MTTAIATAIIAAIGVLTTILGLCGKAVWDLAKRVQKDTDVAEQAVAALKELPIRLKTYEDQLSDQRATFAMLQAVVREVVRASNGTNRRLAAVEFVLARHFPEEMGVAQAAAEDEDSGVHYPEPPAAAKKEAKQ